MSENIDTEFFHSPSLAAFAKALAGAQLKMGGARKTAQNPHLKNRYAQLADVIDAVGDPLNEAGIAYTQVPFTAGKEFVGVITLLMHSSGEYLGSKVTIPVTKTDAQGHGSAYTYLRRYSLMMMAGIAPADDDGNAATGREAPKENGSTPKLVDDGVEQALAAQLKDATTSEQLAAAEASAAKAVQAGQLSGAARARLRELRSDAVKRVSAS